MATAASVIMDHAEIILKDTTNTRWTEAELLDWVIEGQGQIVTLKPDANADIESVVLSAGTIQDLPSTATQLLDATYNMGLTPGTTYGNAVTIVDRAMMDACYPGWQTEAANVVVKHVIYDPVKMPKKFWVYPQSAGANYLQIITAKIPATIASKAANINLGDEYVPVLLDWVLFRCFSKDAEYNESMERALAHLESFRMALGMRETNETKFAPRRSAKGLD
jgi:hypothetical protein